MLYAVRVNNKIVTVVISVLACWVINGQLDDDDKQTIFKLIDKMLTNKKFKSFFQKNVVTLKYHKSHTTLIFYVTFVYK